MDKRDLACYDTGCWLDQLSFAQEMRESRFFTVFYNNGLHIFHFGDGHVCADFRCDAPDHTLRLVTTGTSCPVNRNRFHLVFPFLRSTMQKRWQWQKVEEISYQDDAQTNHHQEDCNQGWP